jgi:glycosyltransferase involved in cell wall biosynthesis
MGFPFSDNKITNLFDLWVARTLQRPSRAWIFTGYSGFCEKSLARAKKLGAITCVERACLHADEQDKVLAEEKSILFQRKENVVKNPIGERMKREYEQADYVIVPSRITQQSFIKHGFPPNKIITVPLCNEKNVPFRKEEAPYPEQFTVLCVGGHFYRKGVSYLLRAWQELQLPDAQLILRGDVPEQFEHLTKAKNLTILRTHMSDEDMAALYQQATISILPSIDEGFGMVVVEAMRAGLPVIVTENVGAVDILTEGKEGFIVPVRDVEALKEKILFFYNNRDAVERMGSAALITAREYTPEKYADRMICAYKTMVQNRNT